jgi:hypothetical protein
MILLSIDPGTTTGCCLFRDGVPILAFTLHHATPETVWHAFSAQWDRRDDPGERVVSEVVIECPDPWLRQSPEVTIQGVPLTLQAPLPLFPRKAVNMKAILFVSAIAHVLYGHFQERGIKVHVQSVRDSRGRRSKDETDFEADHCYPGVCHNQHERDALWLGLQWWQGRKMRRLS